VNYKSQRGLSMIETLMSLFVLVFASVASLTIYEEMWSTFKNGENAAEQQQSVRMAFDKLALDLQLSGYNYDPDGVGRPDEPIEAAFDTAIVLRADFDATNESALAGDAYDTVSVGNDEIVVYALAKEDGSSGDTLTFSADLEESQRDGAVESVSIPNLALVQDDPPYTLFRITLNPDVATWGTSAFFVRTPLAQNVYSLSFRYLDTTGTQVNSTFNLSQTSDDIGGGETTATKLQRTRIRRVELDFVGLTRDPTRGWVDPTDSDPDTRAYRKFQLSANIVRRNFGLRGMPDVFGF